MILRYVLSGGHDRLSVLRISFFGPNDLAIWPNIGATSACEAALDTQAQPRSFTNPETQNIIEPAAG